MSERPRLALLRHLLACGILLSAPASASRIVVLGFGGPGGSRAEATVRKILEKNHLLVSKQRYKKAARNLGATSPTDSNVTKVARLLVVDAIVIGSISRTKRGREFLLAVREGKTGRIAFAKTIRMRAARLTRENEQWIGGWLDGVLASIEPVDSPDDASAAQEWQEPASLPAPATKPAPPAGQEAPVTSQSTGAGTGTSPGADHALRRSSPLEAEIGVAFIARQLAFSYQSTVDTRPLGYRGSPVPALYLRTEIFPLAFRRTDRWWSGIGLSFQLDRAFSLTAYLRGRRDALEATQLRYEGGLLYRWNLGDRATRPTVKFMALYGGLNFTIDEADPPLDLPNVAYRYVGPGAGLRLPLGTPTIAFSLGARLLFVFDTGEMGTPENYGEATVVGFDLDGAIESRPISHLTLKVRGLFTQMGHGFKGTGLKTTNRDADPDADVTTAVDRYFGGIFSVGYVW